MPGGFSGLGTSLLSGGVVAAEPQAEQGEVGSG
jgi:hypothetical protein